MDLTGYSADALEKLMTEFHVAEVDAPELKDGDRAPFRQATFTLHDEQWEEVEAALIKAKAEGGGESAVNENSNGNALAWICGRFNRG
jgi:ParB family chromosome partitioning protein